MISKIKTCGQNQSLVGKFTDKSCHLKNGDFDLNFLNYEFVGKLTNKSCQALKKLFLSVSLPTNRVTSKKCDFYL